MKTHSDPLNMNCPNQKNQWKGCQSFWNYRFKIPPNEIFAFLKHYFISRGKY